MKLIFWLSLAVILWLTACSRPRGHVMVDGSVVEFGKAQPWPAGQRAFRPDPSTPECMVLRC